MEGCHSYDYNNYGRSYCFIGAKFPKIKDQLWYVHVLLLS